MTNPHLHTEKLTITGCFKDTQYLEYNETIWKQPLKMYDITVNKVRSDGYFASYKRLEI